MAKVIPSTPYTLTGRTISIKNGQPLAGLRIRAWEQDPQIPEPPLFKDTLTDADGQYRIDFPARDSSTSHGGPTIFIEVRAGEQLLRSLNVKRAGQDVVTVNLQLDYEAPPPPPPPPPGANRKVHGTVVTERGLPAPGLVVKPYDASVCGETLLGQALTDAGGKYVVEYNTNLLPAGKSESDLFIRVLLPGEAVKVLTTSAITYNAGDDAVLNAVVQSKDLPRPAEFDLLKSVLAPHLCGKALADLQEDGERQDITYLARKTGWDARLIALAALAEQFSRQASAPIAKAPAQKTAVSKKAAAAEGLPPELFYSLLRAGTPTNANGVFSVNTAQTAQIWNAAVEGNVVSPALLPKLPRYTEQFKTAASQQLLDSDQRVGVSTLKSMLDISLGGSAKDQEDFVAMYYHEGAVGSDFWAKVDTRFGPETSARLQLDGKLGFLTLNNGPLINKLRSQQLVVGDPSELLRAGLYKKENWGGFLGDDVEIPVAIVGKTEAEKRSNYAALMANQLKISYPTAVLSQRINQNELPLKGNGAVKGIVTAFLDEHHTQFNVGKQPVEQYLKDNNIELNPEATGEIKRLQRAWQISPTDEAMKVLLDNNLDSAYAIVQFNESDFVDRYAADLGGAENAKLVYAKANQVHSTVLNVTTAYLTYKTNPQLYVISSALHPDTPQPVPPNVIAYPTLEELFGELDFCDCEHCRSVLSPAAYLVELLQLLNPPPGNIPAGKKQPVDVLFDKRPDIQHIQLTCENTNTVLPYIDLVNEILEHYVVNGSIANFKGFNVDEDDSSAELLANPQYVNEVAYQRMLTKANGDAVVYPFSLPFHQPLEALRLYFGQLGAPLHEAMETLRPSEDLDPAVGYGWLDIYLEYLNISRQEYDILTSLARPLTEYFGGGLTLQQLSNGKTFARKMGLKFREVADMLKTPFINPAGYLLPKLEKLGVSFDTMRALHDGDITEAQFRALLPEDFEETQEANYGGNVVQWLDDHFDEIGSLIVLHSPADADECDFGQVTLRYILPQAASTDLKERDFIKIFRFIRLWKKLGWSMDETAKAVTALYKDEFKPAPNDDAPTALQKLNNGFKDLLIQLAHLKRLIEYLNLKPKKDLARTLALWSDIGTQGSNPLYRQMFLTASILKQDDIFEDDGLGGFPKNENENLVAHREAIQASFNLPAEDFDLIFSKLQFGAATKLTLENLSKIFRYAFLARAMKLSVKELLALISLSGIDPFVAMDAVNPAILRFVELVQLLKKGGFKLPKLDYLLRHDDPTGKASPARKDVLDFAKSLRDGMASVEREHKVEDVPDFEVVRSKVALIYGTAAADEFVGALKGTLPFSLTYTHPAAALEQAIKNVSYKIEYDHDHKRLLFRDVMSETEKINFVGTAGVSDDFKRSVQAMHSGMQALIYTSGSLPFSTDYVHTSPTLEQAVQDVSEKISYDHPVQKLRFQGVMTAEQRDSFVNLGGVTTDFKNSIQILFLAGQVQNWSKGTALYSTNYSHPTEELEQSIRNITARIAYDHFRKQLTFQGVMSAEQRDALVGVAGVSADFQNAVRALFDASHLLFEMYPDLGDLYDDFLANKEPDEGEKRETLLSAFLPAFKKSLKALQTKETLSATLGVEIPLVATLTDNPLILHAAGNAAAPSIEDFLNLETAGVSARYFYADDITGPANLEQSALANVNFTAENPLPHDPGDPAAVISAVWRFYLQAPANAHFNFYFETDNGADVNLKIDGESVALDVQNDIWQNHAPLVFEAGKLYLFELTAEKIHNKAILKWQTQGIAKAPIPAAYLYPAEIFSRFNQTYLRLLKSVALIGGLNLKEKETAWFAKAPDFQVNGKSWLNAVPVAAAPTDAVGAAAFLQNVQALFAQFLQLLRYAELKKDLKIKDDALVAVFENHAATDENGENLMQKLTGWDAVSLESLRLRFGLTPAQVVLPGPFLRIKKAMNLVKKFAIPAASLIDWPTNQPSATAVRNLQNALRAKYDEQDWLRIVQPINDKLRTRQRDALVAHILHNLSQNAATEHIDTADKLFEFFLIDVEMDACMKTSRIKQAISSVQLFIQRCLINLEQPLVSPASINPVHWSWMKRYRVWEANRKVFLYPENWLEPELRDNKSAFFKDLESELLQSDITEDTAAVALLNYLEKLDDVAKLEICAFCVQANEAGNPQDDVLHVIARTPGANRKYYYRRREESGAWTPWEKIGLDIEDNPILPVIWKGRLLLFWLNIQMKGEANNQSALTATGKKILTEVEFDSSKVSGKGNVKVEATLSWSELCNGKWQPRRTSDVNNPMSLGIHAPGTFNRSEIGMAWGIGLAGELYVSVDGGGIYLFFNKHSLPISTTSFPYYIAAKTRKELPGDSLTFEYKDPTKVDYELPYYFDWDSATMEEIQKQVVMRQVVLGNAAHRQLIYLKHYYEQPHVSPFFFQDHKHVFFVEPTESHYSLPEYKGFFSDRGAELFIPDLSIPEVWIEPDLEFIDPLVDPVPDLLLDLQFGKKPEVLVGNPDPVADRFQASPIKTAVLTLGTVRYGETNISATGSVEGQLNHSIKGIG